MNMPNEHEIQNLAVKALRKIGFTCIITSNRRRTSNTKGTPDVYVYMEHGYWIGLEFKQPKGKLTVEQTALNSDGSVYIVDSVDKAVRICLNKKSKQF